jgi:hypothetical protein
MWRRRFIQTYFLRATSEERRNSRKEPGHALKFRASFGTDLASDERSARAAELE